VSGINFIVVGILFAVSGIMINLRIKKYFGVFYMENNILLWVATLGLSIPILFRGSLNVSRVLNKDIEVFIRINS